MRIWLRSCVENFCIATFGQDPLDDLSPKTFLHVSIMVENVRLTCHQNIFSNFCRPMLYHFFVYRRKYTIGTTKGPK